MSGTAPSGWLPWRPARNKTTHAHSAPRAPRLGLFGRLFHAGGQRKRINVGSNPALSLARQWILARGGRVTLSAIDRLDGTLPDGMDIRFVSAPQLLRDQPDHTLLLPGVPGFDALCHDIANRATSSVLRIAPPEKAALEIARSAIMAPRPSCQICIGDIRPGDDINRCAECPLRTGHVVLAGAECVRDVVLVGTRERAAYEYTFLVKITSVDGRHTEFVRLAVDAATGEQLAPLEEAVISGAQVVGDRSTPQVHVGLAERLLQPAQQAAARLARAQTLLDYQRRQDDLADTYESLLIEAPENGPHALAARQRALEQLEQSFAVDIEARLVAAATLWSPEATARVRLRRGGALTVKVDPCRGTATPHCVACGGGWHVGARCAEGHVTCLACQQQCAHCGRRRCNLCKTPSFEECATCGAASCAGCAHATKRGRHRAHVSDRHPAWRGDPKQMPVIASELAGDTCAVEHSVGWGEEDVSKRRTLDAAGDELCIADLDAMTLSTWHSFVTWFLIEMGYRIERAPDTTGTAIAFICRAGVPTERSSEGDKGAEANNMDVSAPLAAVGFRPLRNPGVILGRSRLAHIRTQTEIQREMRWLLVTTARYELDPRDTRTDDDAALPIPVFDRGYLAQWLSDRQRAHYHERKAAAAAMDERAAVATRLRHMMIEQLTGVVENLKQSYSDSPTPAMRVPPEDVSRVQGQADTARRALSALDTLVGQWESAFAPRAARDGTQAIISTADELDALVTRAEHLLSVLQAGAGAIAIGHANSMVDEWMVAVRDELTGNCQALVARCQGLDPAAWRMFESVRDRTHAQSSVEHLAAANRAAARARKLHDTLSARIHPRHDSRVGPYSV